MATLEPDTQSGDTVWPSDAVHVPRPRRRMEVAAAIALGLAFTVPLAHTAWWPLSLVVLPVLVALLAHASPRRGFVLGWAFGTAWIAACTWWLVISMHRYGQLPLVLAIAAMVLLAAALGLYLGIASWLFVRYRSRRHAGRDACLFALLWLLAELARARLFTGFPWGSAGYTQIDSPLAGLAPWVGVYGIGWVMAWAAAVVALSRSKRRWLVLLVLPLAMLVDRDFTQPTNTLAVSLVQTNVAQDEKFDPARLAGHVRDLLRAVRDARGALVVAPETAIPVLPADLGPEGFAAFDGIFADGKGGPWNEHRGALIGLPLGDFDHGYTNSVAGFGGAPRSGGARYRYDKHHLVPFGEFIPTGFRWFVQMMRIPLGDFARGPLVAPSFMVAGERIAPNVCYEDLFGEELAQRHGSGGDAPTIHANLSNIAWFGDSVAIDHHRHISRMRSLELQRPMVRSTNTGATAVIDHRGVVQAELPRLQRGVLESQVTGRVGDTPFVRWMVTLGGVGPLAAAAALLAVALMLSRRDFRAPREGI